MIKTVEIVSLSSGIIGETFVSHELKIGVERLKERDIFKVVTGVLVGKTMDEVYAGEYKKLLVSVIDDPSLPVLCNVNIGHAAPRCIIPFGVNATVDANKQVIRF